MKAIISTTYDDQYLFFLPITTWLWNRLGVDVVCFVPSILEGENDKYRKYLLVQSTIKSIGANMYTAMFNASEHKEATYAQCSRLYGACLDLPEDEVLITGDVDMGVFRIPPISQSGFSMFGTDLVPLGQFPMCYISATAFAWRMAFNKSGRTYQSCLDDLLGSIECESFRGNYWGKDQEEAWLRIKKYGDGGWVHYFERARPGTQFADNRVDRDDQNWRAYVNDGLIDAHLWRPGYTDENFANILELLQMKFPNEDFQWLIDYKNEYIKLL